MVEFAARDVGLGRLCAVRNEIDLPFGTHRVYYLYDVPAGEFRGGHAHKKLRQLMVAVSGSFNVTIDDGYERRICTLNGANHALLITSGIWRTLDSFSGGSVCLVLASDEYNEEDYIRDYQEFLQWKNAQTNQISIHKN
jgi:hypothetical protein